MRPTVYTGGLFEDIDPEGLLYDVERATGEKPEGVSADLDSTIVPQEATKPSPKSLAVAQRLAELLPFALISNAGKDRDPRVRDFARQIGSEVGAVTSHETGWKKPFRPSFNTASRQLGVPNRAMVHIGDQPMKDTIGAYWAGYGASVLVEPCAPTDDPTSVRLVQRAPEAVLLELMGIAYREYYVDDHKLASAGYHRAKQIYANSAIGFIAAAGLEVADNPNWRGAVTGFFSLLAATGLADSAITAHGFAKHERVVERMTDLTRQLQFEQQTGNLDIPKL